MYTMRTPSVYDMHTICTRYVHHTHRLCPGLHQAVLTRTARLPHHERSRTIEGSQRSQVLRRTIRVARTPRLQVARPPNCSQPFPASWIVREIQLFSSGGGAIRSIQSPRKWTITSCSSKLKGFTMKKLTTHLYPQFAEWSGFAASRCPWSARNLGFLTVIASDASLPFAGRL